MDYSLDINLDKYDLGKVYYRQGKKCIFDPIREILVIQTPEEIVRQKFVIYLIEVLKVPKNRIEVEVPMAHFKKGTRDRADIVVYGKNNSDELIPQFVVECKAPTIPIVDEVWHQVYKYNEILDTNLVVTTNGEITYAAIWDNEDKSYYYIEKLPSYEKLLDKENINLIYDECESWKRPSFSELMSSKTINEFIDLGWIGSDTSKILYPLIIDLAGFLQDTSISFSPVRLNELNIIDDGHRYSKFGNAAGGSWPGDYRYFILEDKDGNHQIISISIFGSLKCTNHQKFGNRKGHTTLVVAIDDFDKSHNSIQLNIDKYTKVSGSKLIIWHDGTITVGKSGAAKREELIDYIKVHDPELLNDDNTVKLGTFDISKQIKWTQKETRNFVERLIRYALIRDRFRKYKKLVESK